VIHVSSDRLIIIIVVNVWKKKTNASMHAQEL